MDQLEVRVHEEINAYSEKFYGLTLRKWISVIATAIIDVPLYIYLMKYIPSDVLQIMVLLLSAPILCVGFITVQELPMEKFARYFIRGYFQLRKPLIYKTDKEVADEKAYYESLTFREKRKYKKSKAKEPKNKNQNKDENEKQDINSLQETPVEEIKEVKLSKKEIKGNRKKEKLRIKEQKKQEINKKKLEKKIKKEQKILKKMKEKERKQLNKLKTNDSFDLDEELQEQTLDIIKEERENKNIVSEQINEEVTDVTSLKGEDNIEDDHIKQDIEEIETFVSDKYETDSIRNINNQSNDLEHNTEKDEIDINNHDSKQKYDFDNMSKEELAAMVRAFIEKEGGY